MKYISRLPFNKLIQKKSCTLYKVTLLYVPQIEPIV